MGAQNFFITQKARTVEEAFEILVEDAKYERGHDRYNSSISTCSLRGRPVKVFNKYSPKNKSLAIEIAKAEDFGEKRTTKYIDLGVCGYELVEVKRTKSEYSAKYKMMYVVFDEYGKKVGSDAVKGAAEGKAMSYALEHSCSCTIIKKYEIVEGNSCVCEVDVDRKFFLPEDKPRLPRKPGKFLYPIHEYAFYGVAAE